MVRDRTWWAIVSVLAQAPNVCPTIAFVPSVERASTVKKANHILVSPAEPVDCPLMTSVHPQEEERGSFLVIKAKALGELVT